MSCANNAVGWCNENCTISKGLEQIVEIVRKVAHSHRQNVIDGLPRILLYVLVADATDMMTMALRRFAKTP